MADDGSNYDDEERELEEVFVLTGEQKKAAKRMTQFAEEKDPNAAYKERSEMREQYYTMSSKVADATRELKETGQTELMDDDNNEMEGILTKGKEFYSKIGASTKEIACDAELMLNMGQLLLAGAQKLQKAHIQKVLRPKEFAEKIRDSSRLCNQEPIKLISCDPATSDLLDDSEDEDYYRPRNASKRLPEGVENDGLMAATAWAALGRKHCSYLKIPPTLSYFRPLLHDTAPLPKQPKEKKERLPKEDKSKAKLITLSEKDKNHDDPDQSVTRELDCIRKSLKREMKKQRTRSIPYYWFVIDPTDFSKSVENMFYTSFLVKDNHIKIEIDQQKGIPMIVMQSGDGEEDVPPTTPLRAPSNTSAGLNCESTQQAIVGFAYDIWEGMIECLNITEAVIRR
ncbi:hypothetical protein PENTCL1PPCAC_22358 [Pristionchus entomophagus]|uniref:Non-structural maintenance of chromosomes element 4 n=1 Tax=Pristionchus entomophagus TaxID=358040 RepID=A0AAV5U021_9BILA|nr:hypothetical protein PENTCL1PPCAC_22358 [Pristionchus entomophagus]